MDKLKELRNDIHLKIPRLMDDGVGQIYERYSKGDYFWTMISYDPIKEICILFDGERSSQWYLSEIQTRFQPLGMEPMLNDVLEYLQEYHLKNNLIDINSIEPTISLWDLSKPYLKDQSPEFINSLYDLCQN